MFATLSNSFIITTCTGGTRVENIKYIKLCLVCVGPSAWFQAGAAMTDIFIDTRTIGAWAQQTSYSGNTLPGSSDLGLGLEATFPPASRFIIYLSRYLGSWTGPGWKCPLAWSQAQYPWPLRLHCAGVTVTSVSAHTGACPRAVVELWWRYGRNVLVTRDRGPGLRYCAVTSSHLATLFSEMNTWC